MKKYETQDEAKETLELLKQKPEIDSKVSYYKNILESTGNLMDSIDELMVRGYKTEKISFIFPFKKKIILDSYDIAKLQIEKLETSYALEAQKNYFEMWLSRSKEYDKKTSEVDENWDKVFALAKDVTYNIRLQSQLQGFDKSKKTRQEIIESYFYFKKEVENAAKAGKLKLPPVATPEIKESQMQKV